MKSEIIKIVKDLGFDHDFINYVASLTLDIKIENPFDHVERLSAYSDVDKLKIALDQLNNLSDYYLSRKIDRSILVDTLSDLKYRIDRYYLQHGTYGLSDHDMKWLGYVYRAETFVLGSLKYRKYHITFAELERSGFEHLLLSDEIKRLLYEGRNVVYIHIPTNADLSETAVSASVHMAELFFAEHFREFEYDYFICRTWLLYPGLVNIMAPTSNIINFLNRFEIVASHNNPKQTLNRLYGTYDLSAIERMPKPSSLMRTAYKNIDSLGVGIGIIRR